jgi:MoxR-like ATPase|tara:strand:+ start:4013 stop:4999 length:987 start_codon:yes stop_codon:yes gene_type:complete
MNPEIKKLNEKAEDYSLRLNKIQNEIKKVIVGQDEIIKKILIGLVSDGHILIEGVPGLAKTLVVKTLSDCLNSNFVRLQFTPDLLPADITGTKIYDHKEISFKVMKGPIFTNFVLADEINRAPPKVQSALLEAMQEKQVSIQGETFEIKKPFMVLATQNPIESEGTYKLPEAQVDRFMFKVLIDYPTKEDEIKIINRFTQGVVSKISKTISPKDILDIQKFNRDIYVDTKIKDYVAEIVDATRNPEKYGLDIGPDIEYGASPRATLWLIIAAKANAMINGRGYVKPEDVKAICYDVLRHRILLTYEFEAKELTTDDIITKILDKIKVP